MEHYLDKYCGNCNYFFPDRNGPTEYGICLNDPAFAPYEDDILELRFDRCRELIKAKRFPLDHEGCEKFDPVEFLEIEAEDGSTEPVQLTTIFEGEQQGRMHMAYDQNGDIWANGTKTPLQRYIDQLYEPGSQQSGLDSLCTFSMLGNEQATAALLDFFEHLGPPRTLKEVHFKLNLLERMIAPMPLRLMELLLNDLESTHSNNRTRQFLAAIIKSLNRFPKESVEPRLRDMIRRNVFSYRLRKRIEEMLDYS